MKIKSGKGSYNSFEMRERYRQYYLTKYYSLYVNHYKCKELSEEQLRFILSQFWSEGKIACFIPKEIVENPSITEILGQRVAPVLIKGENLIFAPFANIKQNITGTPAVIQLIPIGGATFIPRDKMLVNKDVVIGYGHISRTPIKELISPYIEKLVDIEMTLNTSLFNQKLPRLFATAPEDKNRIKNLIEAIENDEHVIACDFDDISAISAVLNSMDSNIDTLYKYKTDTENEILTNLGIDNSGVEKKERLLTDEVNSNNDLISYNAHCYIDSLKEFGERVNKVFGVSMKWEIDEVAEEISKENETEKETEEYEQD